MFGMAAIVPGCPTLCRHGSVDLAPRALPRIDLQFIVRPIHRSALQRPQGVISLVPERATGA